MKNHRTLPCLAIVLAILLFVCGSGVVLAQGGTGRETSTAPLKTTPSTRKTPPQKKKQSGAAADVAPVTNTPAVVAPKIVIMDSGAFFDERIGISRLVSAQKALDAEFKARRDELNVMQTKMRQLNDEFVNTKNTAEPGKLQQILDQLEQLKRDGQSKSEEAQAMYEKRRSEIFSPIYEDIGKLLDSFKQRAGIASLIDVSAYPSSIIYTDNAIDITKSFIQFYNAGMQPGLSVTVPVPKIAVMRNAALEAGIERIVHVRKQLDLEFAYEKSKKINESDDAYKKRQETVTAAFDRRLQQVMSPIQDDVYKSIIRFVMERGYNLVVDPSKVLPTDLRLDNVPDISDVFVADYNQRNP